MIGAGVVGLSTAIRLQEEGHRVSIWAREVPPNTTSNIAAALWYPYKAHPVEKVKAWAQTSLNEFIHLSEDPKTGVCLRQGKKLFHRRMGDPWWKDFNVGFSRVPKMDLAEGQEAGYSFVVPIVDMSVYLTQYLVPRFQEKGGEIVCRKITDLQEPLANSRIVIHCAGLGAKDLAQDDQLYPIRGQVVRVAPLEMKEFVLDTDHPLGLIYIVPRTSDAILGGTAEDHNWSLEINLHTAEAIQSRCASLVPEVKHAKILSHAVGLRPGRETVRLEAESLPEGSLLVHNYGHGGAGVTLSWGCADEVVEIVQAWSGQHLT